MLSNRNGTGSQTETTPASSPALQTSSENMSESTSKAPVSQQYQIPKIPGAADPLDVTAIIICALVEEMNALCKIFDCVYESHSRVNKMFSTAGRIGDLTVVIHILDEKGNTTAALDTAALNETFPNTSIVLLAGVCGGTGYDGNSEDVGDDVFLGDVIISTNIFKYGEGVGSGGVLDSAKGLENRGRPDKTIRSILRNMPLEHWRKDFEDRLLQNLQDLQRNSKPGNTLANRHPHNCYAMPEAGSDILSESKVVGSPRKRADGRDPKVHLGDYGSANLSVRSVEVRKFLMDRGIIAIEMEGDGVWSVMHDAKGSCLVIKSVSDYADSRKNSEWKHFAAATSASAVKALLQCYYLDPQTASNSAILTPTKARSNAVTSVVGIHTPEGLAAWPPMRDTEIRIPYPLEGQLNRWSQSTEGENVFLWGPDNRNWLKEALRQYAGVLAQKGNAVIFFPVKENASMAFLESLHKCLLGCFHVDGQIPNDDTDILQLIKDFESLEPRAPVTVLLQDLPDFSGSLSADEKHAFEILQFLLESPKFRNFWTGKTYSWTSSFRKVKATNITDMFRALGQLKV